MYRNDILNYLQFYSIQYHKNIFIKLTTETLKMMFISRNCIYCECNILQFSFIRNK